MYVLGSNVAKDKLHNNEKDASNLHRHVSYLEGTALIKLIG